jgi:hypothetical protein
MGVQFIRRHARSCLLNLAAEGRIKTNEANVAAIHSPAPVGLVESVGCRDRAARRVPAGASRAPSQPSPLVAASRPTPRAARALPAADFLGQTGFVQKDLRYANAARVADTDNPGLGSHVITV